MVMDARKGKFYLYGYTDKNVALHCQGVSGMTFGGLLARRMNFSQGDGS
ncbi:hypothetical protein [Pseudomonas sp. NFACC05-1]|nr:hypothetical protein [Pseudomonas sp. NFACC05-1]